MNQREVDIMNLIRLEASKQGVQLWRNNVGAMMAKDGRILRFGLANDSKQLNAEVKSSDLIGITPIKITQAHEGQVLGVFTAVEVKRPDWNYSSKRASDRAQAKFIKIVNNLGGIAYFARGINDKIINTI